MVHRPGNKESHLHPHHEPLPTEFQSTPEGHAAAEAYHNQNSLSSSATTATMASSKLTLQSTLPLLHTPHHIPRLGFGIYQSPAAVCHASCTTALNAGYRHIDSAQFYRNESEMGAAAKQSGIPRAELFLTTKVMSKAGSPDKTYEKCRESVRKIAGEGGYVDLFLIHTPSGGKEARREMWGALERLESEGLVRAIGVSNFGVGHIEELKEYARVWPPMVNQIELHPWCQQRTIVTYCNTNKIVVEAYCPLVRNNKANDPTLTGLAKKLDKPTAQILIRYSLQKGWVTLPKSDTPSRIEANADVYGFELSEEDMSTLDELDQGAEGAIVQAVKNS